MKARLVLASTSAIRRELLLKAGFEVQVEPPDTDEKAVAAAAGRVAPGRLAAILAEAKAISVANRIGSGLIIAADQILSCENKVFSKPASLAEARRHLQFLRHRRHHVDSAICCAREGDVVWAHVARAELVMRDFSDAFLESYLALSGPNVLSSVGAYKLEGLGIQLFETVSGDYFTILGLPLLPLLDFLRRDGAIPA